jgi:hypothetical protein
MPSDAPHSLRHAAITNALDEVYHSETLRSWARHADPRTTEHYDRARGNLDRHGVHFPCCLPRRRPSNGPRLLAHMTRLQSAAL